MCFNLALENAKSDYFCYVLDDDVLYENHLEEHYNHFRAGNTIGHSMFAHIEFPDEKRNVKSLVETSLETLRNMPTHPGAAGWKDVSRMSHTVEIGRNIKWKTQTELSGGQIMNGCDYEDNVFMDEIGLSISHHSIAPTTTICCKWGGVSRSKETKGVDREYYDALMTKVVEDDTTFSGYRLESDSPYVYPEFKNTLFGE